MRNTVRAMTRHVESLEKEKRRSSTKTARKLPLPHGTVAVVGSWLMIGKQEKWMKVTMMLPTTKVCNFVNVDGLFCTGYATNF